jgi:hypothetical protein
VRGAISFCYLLRLRCFFFAALWSSLCRVYWVSDRHSRRGGGGSSTAVAVMLRATARRTLVAVRWPGGSLLHSVSCLVFAIGRCVSSVVYEAEMGFVIPYMAVGWKIRRANGGVQPAPHGTKRTGRQKGAAQKERATGPDWVRD